MSLAIGFLLFLLGAVTFYAWLPWTFYFLQGLVTFSLLFWGFLALLMGYSERKAHRDFAKGLKDGPEPAPEEVETPDAPETADVN